MGPSRFVYEKKEWKMDREAGEIVMKSMNEFDLMIRRHYLSFLSGRNSRVGASPELGATDGTGWRPNGWINKRNAFYLRVIHKYLCRRLRHEGMLAANPSLAPKPSRCHLEGRALLTYATYGARSPIWIVGIAAFQPYASAILKFLTCTFR